MKFPAPFLRTAMLLLALSAPRMLGDRSSGGSYSLEGGPVSGGGVSGGGTFAIDGAAGDASTEVSIGGTFSVAGGLVGEGDVVVPGPVALEFTDIDGHVTLTWPADANGYVLESSPEIGAGANWQPVKPAPPGHTYTASFDKSQGFFRLHTP